jgi:hypothetical protein
MQQQYTTRRLVAAAIQWTGSNLGEVRKLTGSDFLHCQVGAAGHTRLWVLTADGPAEVRDGFWISRADDAPLFVHSAAAFERHFRELIAGDAQRTGC